MTEQNKNVYEGVDEGISEDAFEQDPVLVQYQTEQEQERWKKELEASRKERKNFDKMATMALKRYRDERSEKAQGASNYNIYFQVTDNKMAALYAQLPKADVSRRFNDPDDDVSRVASMILQRNIEFENQTGNFDTEFKQIVFDRAVAGMGVGWQRFEQNEEAQPAAIDPSTGVELQQPPKITDQYACIEHVAWDDFYWGPCKTWNLCPWVARRISMSRTDVTEHFGDKIDGKQLEEMAFSKGSDGKTGPESLAPKNQTEETVWVYEIWDKERGLVFWVCESAFVPLDVKQDTNQFPGFFPTPLPPLGRFDTSNTQPISDFQLTKGKYAELDKLNMRCSGLMEAMQLKFVYDAGNPELKDLFTTTRENEGIGIKNWASFMGEKGGLAGAIQFTPLDDITKAYASAAQQLEVIKAQIYEVEGISDIMRGAATPYETATATNAKSSQSFGRIAVQQMQVGAYAEALLRLKAHAMCHFYTPETLLARAGQLPQADMPFIEQAIALLKNEAMTGFRLNVSVDSMQAPNWNTEKAERTEVVHAVTALLQQALPAVQQVPELAPLTFGLLKFAVAGYKGSKDVEGVLDQGLQQLMQAKAKGQQQGKPSADEIKAQAAAQKTQAQLQTVQMQEDTKRQIAQLEAQLKAAKLQLDAQATQAEAEARAREADLRQSSLALQAVKEQNDHAHTVAIDVVGLDKGGQH